MLITGKPKKKTPTLDIEIEPKNAKLIQLCFKLFHCSRARNSAEVWEFISLQFVN